MTYSVYLSISPECREFVGPAKEVRGCSGNRMKQNSSSYFQGAILVVDDDASVRHALLMTLAALGFTTLEASGGEEL